MRETLKNSAYPGSVLCFGELLLRISPDADGDWLNDHRLPCYPGGAELNVAGALALWGLPVKYVTALPENAISRQLISALERQHIDMSATIYAGRRIGLYFLTANLDLKHGSVIYDRENSAFASLKPGMVDWDKILHGVSWFHFSAICPALNPHLAALCLEGLRAAALRQITISVDLNYRSGLWKYNQSPLQVMPELVSYCDVIMGNIWSAEALLGIPLSGDIKQSATKEMYLRQAQQTSEKIMATYSRCSSVANTFRFDNKGEVRYYASFYEKKQFYSSKEYQSGAVIDRVGSGDCFMAGLIYGFYHGLPATEKLDYATSAAFKQLFTEGDATDKSAVEIKMAMI